MKINRNFFANNILWDNNIFQNKVTKLESFKSDQLNHINGKDLVKLDLSDLGNRIYNYSIDDNNPQIYDDYYNVLLSGREDQKKAYQDYVKETIIGKSIELKKGYNEIQNMNISDDQKKMKTEILDHQFNSAISSATKRISRIFDRCFDFGTDMLNEYSKNVNEEIFDQEIFENHLKYLSNTSKQIALNSKEEISLESLESQVKNEVESSTLEKMSYEDVYKVIGYIYQDREYDSSVKDGEISYGEFIANREIENINRINSLGVSKKVSNAMIKSEKRKSEGLLRNASFFQEEKNYLDNMDYINKNVKRYIDLIKIMDEKISEIESFFGINSKNILLKSFLKSRSNYNNMLEKAKDERRKIKDNWKDLSDNKSKVTETESYKKNKEIYEKTIKGNI